MDITLAEFVTILSQLTLAASAYRLANRVAARQEATDKKVDNHEGRLVVLEGGAK